MKLLTSVCVLLLGSSMAVADDRPSEGGRVRKVTAIIGSSVTVQRGEMRLGKVTDLVINEGGCIDYLVVDSDDGFVVVPWGVVDYNVERRTIVISHEISRERLKDITFTRDRWPDLYESRFTQKLRTAWGEKALRHGDRTGGEDRRPDRDKAGDKDRRDSKDRIDTPKDRVEQPKDRATPPRDRSEQPKDRATPPRDRAEQPRDRVEPPKDRPRESPKDKP